MTALKTAQPARHPAPVTRANRLAYLIWERPDLAKAEKFLTDFGLKVADRDDDTLYLRGTAAAPFCHVVRKAEQARFAGLALEVADTADLDALVHANPGSVIQTMTSPGGGLKVALTDPSGFSVEVVCGQQAYPPLPQRSSLPHNTADARVRLNQTQRAPVQADVVKLGHVVFEVANFQETCAWYTRQFGLIPSDVQVLPDGSPAVVFMRLDLGDTPADHHTIAIAQGFMASYSHSAYELVDADAVAMGQRLLREQGYQHAWGMGRHILGSQIFDYWNDPWGAKHEHYSDGDLFTADRPMGVHPVSKRAMSQWGPTMPASFTKPQLTLGNITALIRNLKQSPDLSVDKLITLAKIFT